MARKCFYSFHFVPDCWRAAKVRGIGVIEGNDPVKDNEWEAIATGPNADARIEAWIDKQMEGKSCAIVLVGRETADRKWINREIVRAWDRKMGVVGIRIHGISDRLSQTCVAGRNPFDFVTHGPTKKPLSSLVKCYDPGGLTSKERYAWIEKHLANAVEEAIKIRAENS